MRSSTSAVEVVPITIRRMQLQAWIEQAEGSAEAKEDQPTSLRYHPQTNHRWLVF